MMAVGFWLAVWQAAAMVIGQEVFLVSPVQALRCLLRLLPQADFWHRVGFSAGRILLGFGLGVVCSAALAVAAEICPAAEILIAPVLQLVKATPVASFIILALVWVAEVIGLPNGSIGDALYRAKITLSTGELFAWTFVIILLSAAFEKLFLRALDAVSRALIGGEEDAAC